MTDAGLALGRRLWDEGVACADIARRIGWGCTADALIGKAHRLGWPLHPGRRGRPVEQRAEDKPHKAQQPKPAARSGNRHGRPKDGEALHLACRPQALAVPTATFRGCQWPVGEPRTREFRFCAVSPVVEGKPYCRAHCQIAYHVTRREAA
jgi:hypothetical protein